MTKRREEPEQLLLRLYIAGDSPNSVLARANLRAVLDRTSDAGKLEIIDVLRDPERALRDGVLVTPTLVRVSPAPERRAVGNLKDRAALLLVMGRTSEPDVN